MSLTKANFVHAIDSEKSGVTVLVHIYEDVSMLVNLTENQ